jgi:hypothetical protein
MIRVFWMLIPLFFVACSNKDKENPDAGLPEMLIFDSIITTTVNDHGFFNFQPPLVAGSNWRSPYDFYNGDFHYRFDIMNYPSQQTFLLSLCIWADIVGDWEHWKETCTGQIPISGNGVYTSQSIPATWWIMNDPVDFSRVDDFDHLGLVIWCEDFKNLSDMTPPSNSCWEKRDELLPLTLRLTIIAVAKDHAFSGWEKYIY